MKKQCVKIIRRIVEIIFLVLGSILLGLSIGSDDVIGYYIFLTIYTPVFYAIYYFPRCCLDLDCLDKSYKCKRNTYFVIVLNAYIFIILISVIIILAIIKLAKTKKTDEKSKDPYKMDSEEYKSFLCLFIFGLFFVLFGIGSIALEIKSFSKEFLYYKDKVKDDEKEKEKEKKNLEENKKNEIKNENNMDNIEVIYIESNNKINNTNLKKINYK